MTRLTLPHLGEICTNSDDGEHPLLAPEDDHELQSVAAWLAEHPIAESYTDAIRNSIDYVLDGGRTGRFDLLSPEVHPGERASVGAKLEYEILRTFKLPKTKPLDTHITGIPVDIKATVGANWSIPTEAHCRLCICTQIQLKKNRHKSWLIRAHHSWLYRGKGNKDQKRGLAVHARDNWSFPLYDWTELPVNPLRYLTEEQAAQVLAKRPGQVKRMLKMFEYLEGHIIPRNVFLIVGAGRQDPMRRARQLPGGSGTERTHGSVWHMAGGAR
ncbi:NaeI family type II restriction endonuclease [Streptomyces monashensis]|uniref:NaeI family type II restriction endonuclease n=1 Tax=Streptomyces monashensis TaxID=1678012 RepID=UPI0009A0AC54|nr:NaeI family type II restriction endonuclease [Streptomyces monashensis]